MSGGEGPEGIPASSVRVDTASPWHGIARSVLGHLSVGGIVAYLVTDWLALFVVLCVFTEAAGLLRKTAMPSSHRPRTPGGSIDEPTARRSRMPHLGDSARDSGCRRLRFYCGLAACWSLLGAVGLLWLLGFAGETPSARTQAVVRLLTVVPTISWLMTWKGRRRLEQRLGVTPVLNEQSKTRQFIADAERMARVESGWLLDVSGNTERFPRIVVLGVVAMICWLISTGVDGSGPATFEMSAEAPLSEPPAREPGGLSESPVIGAARPTTGVSPSPDGSANRTVTPSPTPRCASESAFLNVVGHNQVSQRLLAAWRNVGAVEVGCPSGPPEAWTYLEVVELFGGTSEPSLVVANVDGSAAVVFDDLVQEVRQRADVLTVVEPRTETGRGHYTVLLQEDGSCLLAMRLKSSFPQQVLPEGASAAVFHVAGRVGGVPISFETIALEDQLRFDVRYTREDPERLGTLRSFYVSMFTSKDGSRATWRDEHFGPDCPDPSVRAALAWEAQQVRNIVENRVQDSG